MTQDEARLRLIGAMKENKAANRAKLVKLHLALGAVMAASILSAGTGAVDAAVAVAVCGGAAAAYANLLGKFLTGYSTSKSAVERLESGFEDDFDYLEVYEEYLDGMGRRPADRA